MGEAKLDCERKSVLTIDYHVVVQITLGFCLLVLDLNCCIREIFTKSEV